jgi:peptidyl-prolyl cis-trans isomerase SurA
MNQSIKFTIKELHRSGRLGRLSFRRRHGLWLLTAAALFLALPASAQMPKSAELRILAIVNDEPVSAFDLNQRLSFIIRSSSLPDTTKTRRSLAPRVLRSLIDESLKLQEAKRFNVAAGSKDLEKAVRQLERQNRLPPGKLDAFLKARGIAKATLIRQLKAAIAWPIVIRRRFARSVNITEEDIAEALKRYKANAQKPRHQLAEIFLPIETPGDQTRVQKNAERIIQELQRGASFALLARQFSQSASAQRGGNLGWVRAGQLDPKIEKTISQIPVKTISSPIRSAAGYHIILVRDRQITPIADGAQGTVSLRQILLPVPAKAAASEWASQQGLADTIRETTKGCSDFATVSKELGSQFSGGLGRIKVSELPSNIRNLVVTLPIGTVSKPQRIAGGLRLIMVCERTAGKKTLPARSRVRRQLLSKRLEERARRHLRDLRQNAFIDIRTTK